MWNNGGKSPGVVCIFVFMASVDTPLMKQYSAIKAKYPGALLLFRVGDFYETFGEDAVKTSRILDITLTKRSNGSASEVELAGFPYHALDNYLPKLVRAGQRVAICDQLEDPKMVKGIVKRGVTELVTPGVNLHDHILDVRKNNYLCAVLFQEKKAGIAFLDLSTGEYSAAEGDLALLEKLVNSFSPAEVLYHKKQRKELQEQVPEISSTYGLDDWVFQYEYAYEQLIRQFKTQNLKGFGLEDMPLAITAAGAILHYLKETEHNDLAHISGLSRIEQDQYVWLDRFTIRNLELLQAQHEGGVPLLQILDHSATPMGSRLLRRWIALPLKELDRIKQRLEVLTHLKEAKDLKESLVAELKPIGDLERLISKVAVRRINPREMQQLRRALGHLVPITRFLIDSGNDRLYSLAGRINLCDELYQKIYRTLKAEPPALLSQGGLIADGVDPELDELRGIAYAGKDYLIKLQQQEIGRTGISSLKIAYNKVFGYYLEVTHVHRDKVPADWIRKQTLVNAERYITPELKTYEEKILNAEDRILQIELRIFQELMAEAAEYVLPIQENARVIAQLDVLQSLATVAEKLQYCKPEVDESLVLDIRRGRHPVIECQLPPGESYIPNDLYLDQEDQQIMVITGPNMAGKSALLRQVALISLMAQMGSYVPADYARIGIIDKIFTRVGASDNLSKGESTFMVEMTETASILNNMSDRSLILMDEIGRGTSTYDGISIAWAIVEYLHNHPKYKPKTLFATHYHELNELAKDLQAVKNFNVAVKEVGDKVIFLRTLKAGGSEHSFGIHVAQMAGMPNAVVLRAAEIMHQLEKDPARKQNKARIKEINRREVQLHLFDPVNPHFNRAMKLLDETDINTLSPVEALLKLNELKKLAEIARSSENLVS
jgi:DNA mismatch repair protein MutS